MRNDKHEQENQYIYIVQASLESGKCKIGKTNDLEQRLKEYNAMTGKSKDNVYSYLFTCQVKNMTQVEKGIKDKFFKYRETESTENFFCNPYFINEYVNFIKSHKSFVNKIYIKKENKTQTVKIIRKTIPSLGARGVSRKELLQKAQSVKFDEFYTKYEDVEKELNMYPKSIWKNKVVFCNCDDAVGNEEISTSPFALFFLKNFDALRLKKLICTHYAGKVDLFNQGSRGYIFSKTGFCEIGTKEYPNNYDGSFDHPLSLKILHEDADIVCTNPPFSRAIDFWRTIIESKKRFIIISNITNTLNTAYIHYFKSHKVWPGYNRVDEYLSLKREIIRASGAWYTNVPIKNRSYNNLKIIPLKKIPEKYKRYDDSKVLIVSHGYVPSDYTKPFAVSARHILNGLLEKGYEIIQDKRYTSYMNGKERFAKVLVQKDSICQT
jgi:predicted GIY-YIG superfamily endonuclease